MGILQGVAQKLWTGFWYTRAQCLKNEKELLDNLLKDTGLLWTGRDTVVQNVRTTSSDPAADVVRSVSVYSESHSAGGVDLVCVHGFGQSGAGCFYPSLAGWASLGLGMVHLVDWRGAGLSSRPTEPFAPRNEVEAIEYLVDGLDAWRKERLGENARMCLLGHSMGAIVAVNYAARHPDHVRHLILAGPAAVRVTDPKRVEAFLERAGTARRFIYNVASKAWNAGVTPQMILRSLPFDLPKRIHTGYIRNRWGAEKTLDAATFEALCEYNAGITMMKGVSEKVVSLILKPIGQARTPLEETLEDVPAKVPVTFVYGEHDWMSPASGVYVAKKMREEGGRDNVQCVILPKAGHYPFIDQPEMVHDIVKEAWEACLDDTR